MTGTGTDPRHPAPPGTSIGPNLLTLGMGGWMNNMTDDGILEMFKAFGARVCRTTVQNALVAGYKHMEGLAGRIRESMGCFKYLKLDETPYPMGNKTGYVWVCLGDGGTVSVTVAGTRGAAVLDEYYPHWDTPLTCDGFSSYGRFKKRQRCWAHMLRESEYITHSQDPLMTLLHHRLQMMFHDAKSILPDKDIDTGPMTLEVKSIAQAYLQYGQREFGTKLHNAADHLFTFVNHPDMDPTNNETERMVRRIVLHRKIRMRMVNPGGMKMFGVLMTCFLMWRRQELDVHQKILEVLACT